MTTTNNKLVNVKEKILVILGATGTGKSKLSIDLATRFFPSEIINSDKIQVYTGLDITTNKIPLHERKGVPHHLLGEFNSDLGELTPLEYRSIGAATVEEILERKKLPLVVGGSNSFVHALVSDRFDPELDVFDDSLLLASELRYDCCFLCVDVFPPVLYRYIRRRVDDMFDSGMLEELAEFYESEGGELRDRGGIRKAIGVPEFEEYFRGNADHGMDIAIEAIKINTWQLVLKQLGKIQRLRSAGWDIRRLDATDAFRAVLLSDDSDKSYSEMWEKKVVEPSVEIVKRFLEE